jgi:hypothetical protein
MTTQSEVLQDPFVGARVSLTGLAARPELNGRVGVIDCRKNSERWAVQLVTPDGMRDGLSIALKPVNLNVLTPPPPEPERRGRCIEVKPAPLEAARNAIPVRVTTDGLPLSNESEEVALLQAKRSWKKVRGLKAYTKDATYPDLYCYFDASDTTSPINHFAMRAFTAYPMDIGGLPPRGIRGDVLCIRLEPPKGMAGSVGLGGAGGVFDDGASVIGQPTELSIGVEEMRDALLFYADKDAQSIASDRDMKRTMGRMPPEIAAMMGGGMPVNLGQFTMSCE